MPAADAAVATCSLTMPTWIAAQLPHLVVAKLLQSPIAVAQHRHLLPIADAMLLLHLLAVAAEDAVCSRNCAVKLAADAVAMLRHQSPIADALNQRLLRSPIVDVLHQRLLLTADVLHQRQLPIAVAKHPRHLLAAVAEDVDCSLSSAVVLVADADVLHQRLQCPTVDVLHQRLLPIADAMPLRHLLAAEDVDLARACSANSKNQAADPPYLIADAAHRHLQFQLADATRPFLAVSDRPTMCADHEENSHCLIVFAETVSHAPKKALSSEHATMVATHLALSNLSLIVAVVHQSKRLPALAVVKAKSSTVTLSPTTADAQHAKVLPKAKSSTVTRVLLQLLS